MSIMPQHGWRIRAWSIWHLWAAIAMAGLGVLVTFDAWRDMFERAARDEEASHAFLVPVVAAWLVWVRRRRLRHCRRTGTWIGPLLVCLGWILHSSGDRYSLQVLWHGGAVLLTVGCALTILGAEILRQFLWAFVVLAFLVPVPGRMRQQIAIPMGTATAVVAQEVFDIIGIAVERHGNLLSINNVAVTIAEACNGLRMVFALLLVSFAFAFGTPLRGYVRLVVLLVSPLSAIACNVIRLVPTVWLYGHASNLWADRFHTIAGWVMLGVSFLVLIGVLRLFRWALVPVERYTLAYD